MMRSGGLPTALEQIRKIADGLGRTEARMKNVIVVRRVRGSRPLKAILTKWQRLLVAYANAVPGDVAYWTSERTNVGILAAACWRLGGVALEEYVTKKRQGNGRVDLWMRNRRGNGFTVEAKLAWIPVSRRIADASISDRIRACGVATVFSSSSKRLKMSRCSRSVITETLITRLVIENSLGNITPSRFRRLNRYGATNKGA